MAEPILISVIIPTYHDWERLSVCLTALQKQTLAAEQIEIIVVNNDPADAPPAVLSLPANATLIDASERGSYAARNAGLEVAEGRIVAFTDADCIPSERWLEEALQVFDREPSVQRVAGRIALTYRDPDHLRAAELYEQEFAFDQQAFADDGVAVTANMICYRSVFDAIGLFNRALQSGGDIEWGMRARDAGYEIRYAPGALVHHPARASWRAIWRKAVRVYRGTYTVKAYGEEGLFFDLLYGVYLLRPRWRIIGRVRRRYGVHGALKILGMRCVHDMAQALTHYRIVGQRWFS